LTPAYQNDKKTLKNINLKLNKIQFFFLKKKHGLTTQTNMLLNDNELNLYPTYLNFG
jgi:ABC-type ATPase involved in cell division